MIELSATLTDRRADINGRTEGQKKMPTLRKIKRGASHSINPTHLHHI